MPKVRTVKARKDYPQFGIVKGEVHYVWELMTSPRSSRTFRQKTRPKPSQLTASAYKSAAFSLLEQCEEFAGSADDLREIITEAENLRDETQESFDNMPEGLQQGDTGILLEERIAALEDFINEAEDAHSTLEQAESELDDAEGARNDLVEPDEDDFEDEDAYEDAMNEFQSEDEDASRAIDEATEALNAAREAVKDLTFDVE